MRSRFASQSAPTCGIDPAGRSRPGRAESPGQVAPAGLSRQAESPGRAESPGGVAPLAGRSRRAEPTRPGGVVVVIVGLDLAGTINTVISD